MACSRSRPGRPPPIEAARDGDGDRLRDLLERDADVQARDANGATALVAAAYGNHVNVARVLVDAGADVNAKDDTEQSAYLIATSEIGDDPRLLELTLANGADVNAKDSYNGTGLSRAAERGHAAIVRRLLETAIEVDHVNRLGGTALLEAIIAASGMQRSCACSEPSAPTQTWPTARVWPRSRTRAARASPASS